MHRIRLQPLLHEECFFLFRLLQGVPGIVKGPMHAQNVLNQRLNCSCSSPCRLRERRMPAKPQSWVFQSTQGQQHVEAWAMHVAMCNTYGRFFEALVGSRYSGSRPPLVSPQLFGLDISLSSFRYISVARRLSCANSLLRLIHASPRNFYRTCLRIHLRSLPLRRSSSPVRQLPRNTCRISTTPRPVTVSTLAREACSKPT